MLYWFAICVLSFRCVLGLDPYTYIAEESSIDAYRGSTKEIRCDANSRPNGISTRWERETECSKDDTPPCRMTLSIDRIPSDQQKYGLQFVASDTYILIIKNVDENDEGTYYCQLPLTKQVKVYDQVHLRVVEAPFIDPMVTSSDQFVTNGERVELNCEAFGRPTPLISWTRAGNGLMPGGGFVRLGSKLVIKQMRPEYRGAYICTAKNDIGEAHRVINIDMDFPPEVSGSPTTVSQKVGYETRLFCHVNARPAAVVSWTVNGQTVNDDNPKYRITTYNSAFKKVISKLTILEVESSTYSADIKCIGTRGEDTGEVTFKVKESYTVQPIPGLVSKANYNTYTLSLFGVITTLYLLYI